MKITVQILRLVIFSSIIYSCTSDPGFSDTPEINFISFSQNVMDQGDLNSDSLFMTIGFRDGDGDLGSGAQGITENIIVTDNRTGDIYDVFKVPDIPDPGVQNGLEGTITIKLFTTCCIFPENIPPCQAPPQFPSNDLNFDIVMVDDSGNESDIITTPFITLNCN